MNGLLHLSFPGQVAQLVERSPEKAGVGGSIPSLATMFSITCKVPTPRFGTIWFQFPSGYYCTIVDKLLNLSTTLCCDSGTNCW